MQDEDEDIGDSDVAEDEDSTICGECGEVVAYDDMPPSCEECGLDGVCQTCFDTHDCEGNK